MLCERLTHPPPDMECAWTQQTNRGICRLRLLTTLPSLMAAGTSVEPSARGSPAYSMHGSRSTTMHKLGRATMARMPSILQVRGDGARSTGSSSTPRRFCDVCRPAWPFQLAWRSSRSQVRRQRAAGREVQRRCTPAYTRHACTP